MLLLKVRPNQFVDVSGCTSVWSLHHKGPSLPNDKRSRSRTPALALHPCLPNDKRTNAAPAPCLPNEKCPPSPFATSLLSLEPVSLSNWLTVLMWFSSFAVATAIVVPVASVAFALLVLAFLLRCPNRNTAQQDRRGTTATLKAPSKKHRKSRLDLA